MVTPTKAYLITVLRSFGKHVTVVTKLAAKADALRSTYVRYRTELCHYVIKSAGTSVTEAEDVVQSAFAKYAELDMDRINNHRAFLYKTCYNLAIDHKRKCAVRQKHEGQYSLDDAENDSAPNPERIVEGSRKLSIISKAMWNMPSKRRQLLMMSRFDGLTYAEIARKVNLSETVVRKHIAKALVDCQKALQSSSS